MIISNIEDNHVQSLKLNDDIVNNSQVVGSFLKNTGELSILNLNHTYDNLEHTYIDIKGFGKWYVDELKSDEEYISSTLKLNDITQKFDEDYQDTFSFPATMKEWATWIGIQVGVPLKGDFLNSDIVLNERPYIGDNPSWRNAVQLIAKYSGGYAQKNYDNTYSIKWFDNTVYDIEDWENFVHGNQKPPINVLILSTGDTEDNVKYPEETPSEPHELRIEDDWNYIDRYSINKNIYNQVFGFAYTPITKLNVPYGLLELRAGQKISTKDIEGNDIETYISKHTLEWQGGDYEDVNSWSSSIEIPELKDTSTNYSYANSVLNKVLRVERTTNKNTGDIRDLIQETTNNTEKVTSFEMTLEKIEQEVSYFDDQSQAIAKLTTSIEGIEAQIGSITDTTVSANGIGNITLKNVLTSELLYLQIYPTKEDLSYLNISPKTGLGNNTKLTSRDLLFLKDPKNVFNGKLENGSIDKDGQNGVSPELDTTTYIELKEKLNSINDIVDELDIVTGKGIKRIGKIDSYNGESITTNYMSTTGKLTTGATVYYVLESPQEFTTEPVNIQLRKGYNKIEIKDKNGLLNKTKLSYLADTEKTVEGTNSIIIDDAEPVNARSLIVYGNSFQKTRSGKNVFDNSLTPFLKSSLLTIEPTEIGIKISAGSLSTNLYVCYKLINLTEYVNKTIRMKTNFNYTADIYPRVQIGLCDENGDNRSSKAYSRISGETISFVVPNNLENQNFLCVWFYFNSGEVSYINGDTVEFKNIMLTIDNEDMTYEPYGAMPSPEFPSEIKCVEGISNSFNTKIITEKELKGGTYEIINDNNYIIDLTNSTAPGWSWLTFKAENLKKNTDYIFKFDLQKENEDKADIWTIIQTLPNSENGHIAQSYDADNNGLNFNSGNYETLYIKTSVNANATNNIYYFNNIKLCENNLEDIPFGKFLKLVDTGKNLFSGWNKGIGLSATNGREISSQTNASSDFIKINFKENLNYFISGLSENLYDKICAYNNSKEFLGRTTAGPYDKRKVSNDIFNQNVIEREDNEIAYIRVDIYENPNVQGTIDEVDNLLTQLEPGDQTTDYEPAIPNKVRNTEKFAIEKSTYTIDLTGATDIYLFFYDENDNLISKSGYHKLPYTFNNVDAKYVRFMFKDVNNDNLDVNDIKNLTIYDVNANEPAIRYTLPCNLYYINDEIKDELIIDYEKEQTFVIKRVGINAETGEKYALETARTDFYKYVGIDFAEDGNYLIKMESFTTAYINARALANSIYTAQYPTRVEVNNAIKLSEEGIRQEVNGKVTDLNGNVKELKGSLELKLNTKDLCTRINA